MAQTKGKKSTSTKTKTQTKAKKTPEKDNTPPPAPPAPPIRREVCAFVFLFLAVFTAVGMFNAVINLVLVYFANWFSRKYVKESLW